MTPFLISLLVTLLAEARVEYRAFWVDTFNTALNNHADVVAVVDRARLANANAIFAQVRRRGDAWYLQSLEPPPDFTPISSGFDPLRDLIDTAHRAGIEVHAFVIVGAVWNKNPTFAASETLGPPLNPNHVFNRHGGYDPGSQTIVPGPDNWLTRTLLPDGTGGVSFQGHRFGADFWIDHGHPDAAAYTVDVLMHLVRNYDIDGLHLDRIRYPEIAVGGQTPSSGASIGYNPTSVERFERRHGIPSGSPTPAPGDPLWSQWRRDQVSSFVRRVYLNAIHEKPQLKISAALITFGSAPASEEAWSSAEPYWRVYQDWRGWSEEGIVDLALPMNYKREHVGSQTADFDAWSRWTRDHQYRRGALIGLGGFLNAVEGTLRQTRRALASTESGGAAGGVIFFSMANSNVAVSANPYAIPPRDTPARSFEEFAAALTTGKSLDGTTLYEPAAEAPVFAEPAAVPVLSWKASPTRGHLMGFARRPDGSALDSATVTLEEIVTKTRRTTVTDGQGFFGGVDLEPGHYLVKVELGSEVLYAPPVEVKAGGVARVEFPGRIRTRPVRR